MFSGVNIVAAVKVVSQVPLGSEIQGWTDGGKSGFRRLDAFFFFCCYLFEKWGSLGFGKTQCRQNYNLIQHQRKPIPEIYK